MSEAAVDVRQAFKAEYNSYNAVVARWLKDVLELINDRVRPKISLARTMSSWATLSLQEGESIESFLQRESELWLLLASHSAATDQSPFNWKERRARILSAILVVPSWRSSIGPWISALKTADNYSVFRELIKEAKKTILTLKALPKSEAILTCDNPMHFGPLPSTVFRGPTWKRSVDPHLPEPMSAKAPDSGVVSGACRSGPKADGTQGRGPRGRDPTAPKVETKKFQSASRQPQRPVNKQKAKDRSEGRCFKCHVKGHLARDCPIDGEVEKTDGSKTVSRKAPAVNVTAMSPRRVETAYVGAGEPFTDEESETSEPARLCACAVANPSQHTYDISSSRDDDLVYVHLTSVNGRSFKALIDPGSQLNLVEESVVNGADALASSDTSRKDMSISGIGGKICGKPVTIKIYGPASKRVLRLKGYSVPELPGGSEVLLGIPGLRALKARLDLGVGEMSLCASALANNDKLPIKSSSIDITAHLDVIREHPIPRHRGYPLAPEKLEVAHKLVREMEDKGWIKIIDDKDTSQWFCPTFLKLKSNGKVRVLNDLREVNARIRSFASQSSFGAVLGGIPRYVESQRFLGGVLGGIRFKWLVCPQGLSISPYFWELYLSSLLSGIEFPPQVTVLWYVDDIIICALDDVSALAAKKAIISALVNKNVMVAEEKCCGPARSVNFLGLVIDEHGWKPQEEPLDQLRRLPKPRNRGELHSFLGVVNYLRGVYDPSELQKHLAPLQDLLVKGRRFQWSEAHDLAFEWL
ncbi:gag/pol/env polyprotein, putative [Perkinsus marinus ATCC 50983]|uniref:Gag/pol/env polyprotein, putative n=1 Tax=Perkinsus marinus (strain ATCC 50983 / TXsc) TaxID=423536 RepID=C5LNB8_PERM5|nr:gag/pol/env polyprotein, putative [Perkinsus marinus ATCC 50983]EER01797.1 gag/pol/env polyprotein, putative [Perkinsus marinus ATCC 50983]|eukprot:XP_002769079.1 gag/pol/env polyprotein, putative [Perkinsus marinus ATCC 50983]